MGSVPNQTTKISAQSKAFSVSIIGGGIGGLTLAIGLLKHPHIDVQVYESAPSFGEIGAGVGMFLDSLVFSYPEKLALACFEETLDGVSHFTGGAFGTKKKKRKKSKLIRRRRSIWT